MRCIRFSRSICMWQKIGGAQKPKSLGVWKVGGGLKPRSLIEVYAYAWSPQTLSLGVPCLTWINSGQVAWNQTKNNENVN